MNKIEMIRPLTFEELDCVAGVMMAFWTVGARELAITADANGGSVHCQDTLIRLPAWDPANKSGCYPINAAGGQNTTWISRHPVPTPPRVAGPPQHYSTLKRLPLYKVYLCCFSVMLPSFYIYPNSKERHAVVLWLRLKQLTHKDILAQHVGTAR